MKNRIAFSLFVFMVLVGLWATAGHYLASRPSAEVLATVNVPPGPEWFLEQLPRYDQQVLLTALHVIPSFVFMLLLLLQLSGRLRQRYPQLHRWNGRLFVLLGFLIGCTGLILGIIMPFGGTVETLAVIIMGVAFLLALFMGLQRIRQGRITEHRYWMLHMIALGISPLTMRLLLGVAMYTTDFSGVQLFGPSMFLAMAINLFLLHAVVLKKHSQLSRGSGKQMSQLQES